jgi:hypothetical protein
VAGCAESALVVQHIRRLRSRAEHGVGQLPASLWRETFNAPHDQDEVKPFKTVLSYIRAANPLRRLLGNRSPIAAVLLRRIAQLSTTHNDLEHRTRYRWPFVQHRPEPEGEPPTTGGP